MANFDPLTAEIGSIVCGTPANFNRLRVLDVITAPTSLTGGQPNLHDFWPSPGLVHYIYTFGGSCPLREFCQLQNSLCVQVLRSPILAALLHSTRAVSVSQTLQRGTRNGMTELLQSAPPVFGREAITLGIGPNFSLFCIL